MISILKAARFMLKDSKNFKFKLLLIILHSTSLPTPNIPKPKCKKQIPSTIHPKNKSSLHPFKSILISTTKASKTLINKTKYSSKGYKELSKAIKKNSIHPKKMNKNIQKPFSSTCQMIKAKVKLISPLWLMKWARIEHQECKVSKKK